MAEVETLLRELVAAQTARAENAERALQEALAMVTSLREDAETLRTRRNRDATRKRDVRGHSTEDPRIIHGDSTDTPPAPLSPQVSSSSPTPLITTSFPPITPPPVIAVADAPHPAPIPPPEPKTPGRRSKASPKYPAFPDEDCGLLWQAWSGTFGGIDYPVFRKALGSFYQASKVPPAVAAVTDAIKAYREAVDEMDEREAGWQNIHKFAQRIDHWLKIGAMPYSTNLGVLTERGRVLGSKAMREQSRGARTA